MFTPIILLTQNTKGVGMGLVDLECTVSGLDNGRIYYFAVTAYNESDESEFSFELTCCSDMCGADIDIDGDIDGSDLAGIIEDSSVIALSDFTAGFGTENCAN